MVAVVTLRDYVMRGQADSAVALRELFKVSEKTQWKTMADVRQDFPSADFVGGDRLVFNIGGNKYRLVCLVHFGRPTLFVLWVGTHAEYDRINVRDL